MQPVQAAFGELWPQARLTNLLDDSLSQDRAAAGALDAAMTQRFIDLALYVKRCGANGILFTCSAFGPAIEAAAQAGGLPTLKPNEAMFDEALDQCAQLGGSRTIGLLTTFAPAAQSLRDELVQLATDRGASVNLEVACANGAMEALAAGNAAEHDRLVLEQARTLSRCDLILLGQFSMAATRSAVESATGRPVLTSPHSAVRAMQKLIGTP
ncbi:MAG: aspartate/glutamate racemase family protein [Pseudomonadota bacterium]